MPRMMITMVVAQIITLTNNIDTYMYFLHWEQGPLSGPNIKSKYQTLKVNKIQVNLKKLPLPYCLSNETLEKAWVCKAENDIISMKRSGKMKPRKKLIGTKQFLSLSSKGNKSIYEDIVTVIITKLTW